MTICACNNNNEDNNNNNNNNNNNSTMDFFLDFHSFPCYPGVGKGHRSSGVG